MREETLVKNVIRHKKTLEGMLTAMVGDVHAAEDLFQEMAVVMTRRRDDADEDCRFVAWARAIAVNVVRDYRKRMARRKVRILSDEALESVAEAFSEAEDSMWELRREALKKCSSKLPAKERGLLRRRYEQAEPVEELAASLRTTRGAIDTMLYRIRKGLLECIRGRLQDMGVA